MEKTFKHSSTKIFVGCAPRTGQFIARLQLNGNRILLSTPMGRSPLSSLPRDGGDVRGDLSTLFIWLRRSRARFCLVKKNMTVVVGTLFLWLTLSVVAPVRAQTKITVGYAAISPRTIPLIIAQEQGIFAKRGIETRLVLIKGAPILVASLLTGDIEVGYTGGTSVLGAAAQGPYLKILASISSKLTHMMIASPNFKSAEQLRGKRFGIQSMGGSTWMHTILGLEHVGLDVKRDNINILIIEIGRAHV